MSLAKFCKEPLSSSSIQVKRRRRFGRRGMNNVHYEHEGFRGSKVRFFSRKREKCLKIGQSSILDL